MACSEINIKPSDERMYEIISPNIEGKWRGESEVSRFAGVEVESKDGRWVSNYGFDFHSVD
jgi:hypothetical protein